MNLERNPEPRVERPMRRLTPTQIGLIIAGVLILAFAIWTASSTRRTNPDRLPEGNATTAARTVDPQGRCASQATYDLIKRELFRRAASIRGSDQAAFDKLAGYSVVRIDRPLLANEDEGTGAVGCTGSLVLDLPPGVAVVGGRRTLTSDIGYTLQGSADGNGQVLTLTNADALITPLATIARVAGQMPNRAAPTANDPLAPSPDAPPVTQSPPFGAPPPPPAPQAAPPQLPRSAPPLAPRPAPPPAPRTQPLPAAVSPSFNCARARTRGEIAVCHDAGLAALDRQMSSLYLNALRGADPETRNTLQRSRDRFLGYRDQCPSNDCIAQTYRGRMREISDIASGNIR